jgi:hypothetical protein
VEKPVCACDAWWWLIGKLEVEFFNKDFLVVFGLGVAAQDEGSPVHGWEVNVEHLHGGNFFDHGSLGQAAGEGCQRGLEGGLQAVGQERDKPKGREALRETAARQLARVPEPGGEVINA